MTFCLDLGINISDGIDQFQVTVIWSCDISIQWSLTRNKLKEHVFHYEYYAINNITIELLVRCWPHGNS